MQGSINREGWRRILSGVLPGNRAHEQMAPSFRGTFHHESDPGRAAVMILLYPYDGEICLVLIKRNEYDGPHSAQVSFPGGAWEEKDGSLENTALRETREELGISEEIEILGSLTKLHIPVSNFLVSPFVGCTEKTPVFRPDASEVQFVIEIPLKELLDPGNQSSEQLVSHGRTVVAPFYRIGREKVWGATAMMLSEFLQLASKLP